jgi:hypothetical protein
MGMDPGQVHQLVYVSAGKVRFSEAELVTLLATARANNGKISVSGMLVHHEGSFFQVLEGDEDAVETLFGRISRDPRHHRVLVLTRQALASPDFGDWSMGFVEGKQAILGQLPGFNDFFRRGFERTHLSENPGRVKELILSFREGRFRQFVDV